MTNETETLTSGIDPASFSSVIKPTNDLFRYVNGPWIDTYRLPDDRSRYGSFDKLAEDAENQVRDILDADDCPAVKSEALYRSFLNTDAIEAAGCATVRSFRYEAENKGFLPKIPATRQAHGSPDRMAGGNGKACRTRPAETRSGNDRFRETEGKQETQSLP